MIGRDDQDERQRAFDGVVSAGLLAPETPVDGPLITETFDALSRSGQHPRRRPAGRHSAPRSASLLPAVVAAHLTRSPAELAAKAAGVVVACLIGVGGLAMAAYAGVLPDPAQSVAHHIIDAPDVQLRHHPQQRHTGPPARVSTARAGLPSLRPPPSASVPFGTPDPATVVVPPAGAASVVVPEPTTPSPSASPSESEPSRATPEPAQPPPSESSRTAPAGREHSRHRHAPGPPGHTRRHG